ncbi:MAG: DUF664 domain-containing protein [Actinobacteria bacterium]|nr:DUF664 domain-containing protein [Actinomycetota bacterium]
MARLSQHRLASAVHTLRGYPHSDETINVRDIGSPGYAPWWPRPNSSLFNVLVHLLGEINRHAGQAGILQRALYDIDRGLGVEKRFREN